ncbi:MAG: T9SS type A sorting domain-containing protein [Ignavibacteriaceae bacterium]|nr:T9SS type A sorting domain-containing protein [Ignavibacteriaceae bacterium]
MKYKGYLFIFLLFAPTLFAQNNWNLIWSLHQKPFQDSTISSEMAIVKAGFDTDQDGKGEFLCAYTDLDSNYILMYEATGNDAYDLVWYWKYPIAANSFAGIAVGDLDNNGIVDIITTMPSIPNAVVPNPPRVWAFEWNGVPGENKYGFYTGDSFVPSSDWNFNVPDLIDFRPYSLTIEDIDSDGSNELVVGVRQGGRGDEVMVCSIAGEFSGFGMWNVEYNLQGLTGGSLYNVTTGDLDNDGHKEIYAFVWDLFTLYIIESTGPDQYALVDSLKQISSVDYGALDAVRVADVNGDNINEMYIAATEPDNIVFIITNITDVSTITASDVDTLYSIPVTSGGKLRSLYIADPDEDGKLDLMIGGELNGQIFDLEYNGSGDPSLETSWDLNIAFDMFEYSGFAPTASPTISPRMFYGCPAGDMDGDGLNEYVFVNYRSSFPVWPGDGYVWVIEADKVVGVNEDNSLLTPNSNWVSQNYPNPFNPVTNINFNLQKEGNVTLAVFDVLGNEIKTLINENMGAGLHKVSFNATDLSSGIYFYKLQSGSFVQSKKMIVLK